MYICKKQRGNMKNLYPVSELYNGTSLLEKAPKHVPIIYTWWFPSDSKLLVSLKEYVETHVDDKQMSHLLSQIEPIKKGSNTYYALYFGKGVDGRRRFTNHVHGIKRYSTLRRTIGAILKTNDEKKISAELNNCYYEWTEFNREDKALKNEEKERIEKGNYPLNIQTNPKISKKWKSHIQQLRKNNKG